MGKGAIVRRHKKIRSASPDVIVVTAGARFYTAGKIALGDGRKGAQHDGHSRSRRPGRPGDRGRTGGRAADRPAPRRRRRQRRRGGQRLCAGTGGNGGRGGAGGGGQGHRRAGRRLRPGERQGDGRESARRTGPGGCAGQQRRQRRGQPVARAARKPGRAISASTSMASSIARRR